MLNSVVSLPAVAGEWPSEFRYAPHPLPPIRLLRSEFHRRLGDQWTAPCFSAQSQSAENSGGVRSVRAKQQSHWAKAMMRSKLSARLPSTHHSPKNSLN